MLGVKRGGGGEREREGERGKMDKGQEITFYFRPKEIHCVQKSTLCTKKYTVYKIVRR